MSVLTAPASYQVVRFPSHEHRRMWKLHIVCLCSSFCRSTVRHSEPLLISNHPIPLTYTLVRPNSQLRIRSSHAERTIPQGTSTLLVCLVLAVNLCLHPQRDLLGIFIAMLGAITVVLAANTSDVRLDPAGLQRAISQRPFIVFSCIYVVAAIVLAGLSEGRLGRSVVFVDVGLCAIFGGCSVVSFHSIKEFY